MSKKFGSAMLRMGAETGDVLAMVLPNIPEFPIAFLGACGAGLVLSPMNPTYTPGMKAYSHRCHQCRIKSLRSVSDELKNQTAFIKHWDISNAFKQAMIYSRYTIR